MSIKRLAALTALALFASTGFAQKPQAPGTHITVSKTGTTEYPANYTTIQAAVNAARAGQVIEILDTSTYSEQVTIDGRDESPWPGGEGGKNGITIRYVPPSGTPVNSGFKRPTIKHQDKTNTSPKTSQEAQQDGELPGRGGNFETCGALRIIRTEGVTIEGIAIDGGGPAPFGYTGVWGPPQGGDCSALTHGNAALTLVVAGGATIRNRDIKNANNLLAHWKVGATHLLFNNIFSEPHTSETHYMNIDHRFPNRMHNSVMAARSGQNGIRVQCQTNYDCDNGQAPGGCFLVDATITNKFGAVGKEPVNLRICNQGQGYTGQTQSQSMAVPGALITAGPGAQMVYPIPASAEVRWLEMTKRSNASELTYDLFESTDPDNAKFLWPKWDDTLVIRLIKNKGWTGANIRNADGLTADIGAISSAGGNNTQPATVACVKPTSVVLISGTTARTSFYLNVDAGTLGNPTIKFLRWVAPLPNACKDNDPGNCSWAGDERGQSAIELPASAIRDLTSSAPATVLNVGGTKFADVHASVGAYFRHEVRFF